MFSFYFCGIKKKAMLYRRLVFTWVLLSAIVTVFAQDKVAIDQISLTRDADSVQLVIRVGLTRLDLEPSFSMNRLKRLKRTQWVQSI